MSLNLMTGYAGEPHIASADDGAVNAAIYGASKYVLNTGQKFAYELISNNLIKIKDGYAMNQGRKIGQAVNDYEELTIDNGLQGVKRSDIIAIRYSKNSDTGIESAEFVVIKGTSGDDYKDPACETGNIIQGDLIDDFPLYRIKIDGINITAVEPMFDVLMSMEEIQRKYDDILGIQDISKIGDGTVTGAIYSMNSNLEVKNIHVSDTPNWQGCINLGLSTENNEFVLAIIGSRYEIYYFAYLQKWYAKVMENSPTYSPINANAVEFDVLYIVLP